MLTRSMSKKLKDYRSETRLNDSDKKTRKKYSTFFKEKSTASLLKAEARKYGYECKNVRSDGNCFFRAIAHQLSIQGLSDLGSDHAVLRTYAVDYIHAHLDEYKNFLDEHDGDMRHFIEKNRKNGTWADHVIISALSRALNINIVVIRSDGVEPTLFKQKAPVTTLYIGHEVGKHYQSLIEKKSFAITRNLQEYIEAAPYDLIPDMICKVSPRPNS